MNVWLVTALFGVITGFVYYWCVRFRMYFAPILGRWFGERSRQIVWILVFLLVIAVANLSLGGLRVFLHAREIHYELLPYEMLFAGLSLVTGLALVFARVLSTRSDSDDSSSCDIRDNNSEGTR